MSTALAPVNPSIRPSSSACCCTATCSKLTPTQKVPLLPRGLRQRRPESAHAAVSIPDTQRQGSPVRPARCDRPAPGAA